MLPCGGRVKNQSFSSFRLWLPTERTSSSERRQSPTCLCLRSEELVLSVGSQRREEFCRSEIIERLNSAKEKGRVKISEEAVGVAKREGRKNMLKAKRFK
jgi:hypothetical protein